MTNETTDKESPTVKRYIHQPLTIDHYGIHARIQENGKVIISRGVSGTEDEYDEIEVPASLIFKLAGLLRDTRIVVMEKK